MPGDRRKNKEIGAHMSVITRPRITARPAETEPDEAFATLLSGPAQARRRPTMVAAGVGLLALGALSGALLLSRGTEQRTALVASRNISAGEVIATTDIRVVRIARDSEIRSLPSSDANQVLNGVASVPIGEGALVLPEQINRTQTAPAGTVLVGTVLEPGELPSPDLRFGDRVKVLIASDTGGVDDTSHVATEAVIWRIWGATPGTGSKRAVTLAVPDASAVEVGSAAARNSIRLLVIPNQLSTQPQPQPEASGEPATKKVDATDPVVVQP